MAVLNQVYPDIGPIIVASLADEFRFLTRKKDQRNIESRLKNIRFIGEVQSNAISSFIFKDRFAHMSNSQFLYFQLCKFKVYPPNQALNCFKKCVENFVHHNIDVGCNFLEVCGKGKTIGCIILITADIVCVCCITDVTASLKTGRFLYRNPETHVRTNNLITTMWRIKAAKNFDSWHSTLVRNFSEVVENLLCPFYFCPGWRGGAINSNRLSLPPSYSAD